MAATIQISDPSRYAAIYALARLVPHGRIAAYGDLARCLPRVSPRQVGYAMATLDIAADVPWHRIVNAQGMISVRPGDGPLRQRRKLIDEGVTFNAADRIDWRLFGWGGPPLDWFLERRWDIEAALEILATLERRG